MRFTIPAVLVLCLAGATFAGDEGVKGRWKFSIYERGQQTTFWLLHLESSKDGKLTASGEPLRGAPGVKIDEVKIVGDLLQLKMNATIKTPQGPRQLSFDFEGKLPKPGAKKILGSFSDGDGATPAALEATTATTIFELDRETVLRTPTDPKAFVAIFNLINDAKENKVAAKELQEWVDSSLKAADAYGSRYQTLHGLRLLEELAAQKAYASVAAETAGKFAKQIEGQGSPLTQLDTLTSLGQILRQIDKKDDAAALEARIEKLEVGAFTEYSKTALNYRIEKFAGRKAKSTRAVLVELFTGAQCPSCVAADMAFDGLEKSYAPADVVLLQYHMHIPRPEPMTNADSEARFEYYAESYAKRVRGPPAIVFNGKPDAPSGGGRDDAGERYKDFCETINKLLEAPTTVQISASAVRTGDTIAIKAKVSDLDKPGDKIRLRLVLVEDWVRYKGTNGLQYHHRVVRAMPGGAKGFSLKAKDFEQSADIDIVQLRKSLNKQLNEEYPDGPRPMRLQNLHVVAFVQNDDTTEVLHAVEVPVKEK